jgi:hypothetical protein
MDTVELKKLMEDRLRTYCNEHSTDFHELKNYFMVNSELIYPSVTDSDEAYLRAVHNYLVSQGY